MNKYIASIEELKALGFTYEQDHRWTLTIDDMKYTTVVLECWEYKEFELLIINKDLDFDRIFLRVQSYEDLKTFLKILGVKDERDS